MFVKKLEGPALGPLGPGLGPVVKELIQTFKVELRGSIVVGSLDISEQVVNELVKKDQH